MHGDQNRNEDKSKEKFEALFNKARREAYDSLWAYRQFINPDMIIGWWQREVASELHRFWLEYKAGRRPKLILQSPAQHGKSIQITDFISWITGQDPNIKVIFASFSDRLGIRTNLRLQRIYDSQKFQQIFKTRINERNIATLMGRQLRNNQIIEFSGTEGYFRNTTVMGAVTGEGLDIGVIDDPIKGRAEASSPIIRDKTWEWLTDDFMTRFSAHGALLMVMTRWHLDDPAGRMIERFPGVKVLRYPAIAVEDEEFRKKGEALFPELKPLDFLEQQKSLMTIGGWESVYQQNPMIVGGGIFPIEKFSTVNMIERNKIIHSVRYIDKAGTEGGEGAFTAMVLMHRMVDDTFLIEHVARGRWSALEREQKIKMWAERDREKISGLYEVYVEQEPGSGGKESAENTIRNLAGFSVYADKVTGSKEVRAEPYAAQVQGGNVKLAAGEWQYEFLNEHEAFPNGKYKDKVDAAAGAFAKLAPGTAYLTDYSKWV
jgi:predicted phage terminase large subunit-like protein